MSNEENKSVFPRELKVNLLPETIALIQQADSVSSDDIVIATAEDYATAVDQMQKIKGLAKHLDESRKVLTKPIDELKTDVMDYYKPRLAKLTAAEGLIKTALIAYDTEQEKQRQIAAAKAEESARKERERLEARAEKLTEQGKHEQAEAVANIAAATVGVAPAAVEAAPKAAGISKSTTYSAEVKDARALVKAVAAQLFLMDCMGDPVKLMELVKNAAASRTPELAVIPDEKFLNAQAKSLKDHFPGTYPGVNLKKEATMSSRAKSAF